MAAAAAPNKTSTDTKSTVGSNHESQSYDSSALSTTQYRGHLLNCFGHNSLANSGWFYLVVKVDLRSPKNRMNYDLRAICNHMDI